MLLANPLTDLGDLRGTMYDFENKGDVVPKHVHVKADIHITIVARGKIKAYSHDWEQVAVAGQILNFRAGEPHEIMAMEDNTRIFNILKHFGGEPNDYNPAKD
jgi:quercetin dioxygenase-like cupin family protein